MANARVVDASESQGLRMWEADGRSAKRRSAECLIDNIGVRIFRLSDSGVFGSSIPPATEFSFGPSAEAARSKDDANCNRIFAAGTSDYKKIKNLPG